MKKKYPLEEELAKLNRRQFHLTRKASQIQNKFKSARRKVLESLDKNKTLSKEDFNSYDNLQKSYYRNKIKMNKNLVKIKKV